jgi:hypothetical protein
MPSLGMPLLETSYDEFNDVYVAETAQVSANNFA